MAENFFGGYQYPFHDYTQELMRMGALVGGGINKAFGGGEKEDPNWKWNKDIGQYYDANSREAPKAPAAGSAPPKALSAAQAKAFYTAQEKLPGIENSIATLERALELNPKTFDGWLSSERANVGARGPEWLSGAVGIDKEGALATEEWERLTTPEAIQKMGQSFVGATTEGELLKMLQQIADTSIPKQIRQGILERLVAQAKKEREIFANRVKVLGPRAGEGEASAASAPEEDSFQEGMTATNPQTGEKVIFRNGTWEPL